MKRLLAIACTSLALSCGGGSGSSAPTAPSPAPAPAPSPAPAPDPAPTAMQGTWMTTLRDGSNQRVTLVLTERTYRITRGSDGAGGSIAVRGDVIEFSNSNLCVGTGAYRWSLTASSLQLIGAPVGSDPCSGRAEVLDGYTYTKGS